MVCSFVSVAPRLLLKPNRTLTETGRNVTWLCSATGNPRPRVTWAKARGALPSGSLVTGEGSLVITGVRKSDSGLYTCRAENLLGSVTASEQLVVFTALSFVRKPPEKVEENFGISVQLPCEVKSELHSQVMWQYNGDPNLPSGAYSQTSGGLLLPKLSKSLEGRYTCIARNRLGSVEASSLVLVKGHAPSCSAIEKLGSGYNGSYVIDPDGPGGVAPFTVHCDMRDKNGVGVTVISHDSEIRTQVDGYKTGGSYSRDIVYSGADLSQLASLAAVSAHCEQFIKYECRDSRLMRDSMGWWVSRDQRKMTYWGGASPGSGKCACGMTNSCANRNYGCNCDKNDNVWCEDSGLLTDKSALPVTQLRFGDTGYSSSNRGYHTLGKLKCHGIA